MVIVRLIGGLGNQMFQYAAGKALALYHGTELLLDLSVLAKDPKGAYTKREFELDIFDASFKMASLEQVNALKEKQESFLNKLLPSRKAKFWFNENGLKFHPDIFSTSPNVLINGYWQSEKYFNECTHTIRKDFSFKKDKLRGIEEIEGRIRDSNSVSLHIRRGDYVASQEALNFHGVCDSSYYERAIEHIASKQGAITLFVFSDDAAWCRNNLKYAHKYEVVETGSLAQDMYLMKSCRHHIIANSSFSWWAAWLDNSPQKMVVAPSRWFNDAAANNNDIVPDAWIKL